MPGLIAALRAIEPGLVAKESRAVSRSVSVCDRLRKEPEGVEKYVELEFEGGTVPDVTAEQAKQIIAAVQSSFCE